MKRVLALTAPVLLGVAGCGDPLLPADFTGPPEAKVGATVLVPASDYEQAVNPRLSISWLSSLQPGGSDDAPLLGQTVSFTRSPDLKQDWDIGLSTPSASARTALPDEGDLSLVVGKMVYFDDRNRDGVLNWNCQGASCDRLLAVSEEFVVYVREAVYCHPNLMNAPSDRLSVQRLGIGYHYFGYGGASRDEVAPQRGLKFLVGDEAPPVESDLVNQLRAFTGRLLYNFNLDTLGGCVDMAAPSLP